MLITYKVFQKGPFKFLEENNINKNRFHMGNDMEYYLQKFNKSSYDFIYHVSLIKSLFICIKRSLIN